MKKSPIKLNSQEWCDVVFKDKNKSYGAYEMRMSSSKRHIVAFLVAMCIAMALVMLLSLNSKSESTKGVDEELELTIINV